MDTNLSGISSIYRNIPGKCSGSANIESTARNYFKEAENIPEVPKHVSFQTEIFLQAIEKKSQDFANRLKKIINS